MEGRMKQFRKGVLCDKPRGPDDWKYSEFKAELLKKSNCPDLNSFLISFDHHMGGQIETCMPIKKSGFLKFDAANGVVPKTYYYKEPHGIQCQNPAHLGATQSLDVEHEFCEKCITSGGNILNQHYWTLPKLIYLRSTCPIFFVVLVSRSSTHLTISNSMYKDLDETIIEKNRKITDVLRRETGLQYEIHVIAEVGIQGSALSALADSHGHLGNDENKLHLPAADISNLFFFYNSYRLAKFGYLSNSPGDLTGKLSNHINNLRLLERGGINPSDVYFMSYGVHIEKAENKRTCVKQNFTMFNGKKMLERAEEIKTQNFPNSTEANVDGYITGMAKEGSSRILRNINMRKVRVGKKK